MSRFLFTVIPEKGHLNPVVPVAQHLVRAGHEVAFHASSDIAEPLARAGIHQFLGVRGASKTPHQGARFSENVRDRVWLRDWIRSMLIDAVPPAVTTYRDLCATWAPDVVVTDPMLYASVIAACSEGLRWVALSNSLNPILDDSFDSELLQTVASLTADRDALFERHRATGVRFRGCDALSPHLTTCFATEAFAGRRVPGVELVGPSRAVGARGDETPFPWERLSPERAKIYASFGSQIYHQPARFNALVAATRELDAQLILSVSDLELDCPDHVIAVPYAPQPELLERVDLLVTHGGANSVMESLAAGVPIAVAPICNDQPHQARFVTMAGVGELLPIESLTTTELSATLGRLLGSDDVRAASRRMAQSYARDGAARAAELTVKLAGGN